MCKHLLPKYLKTYENYHTNFWTRITHYIGIPLVLFAVMIFFSWFHLRMPNVFDMPLVWLLSIAALVYYFLLDITLSAIVALIFILFNVIITLVFKNEPSRISFIVFLYAFIIGWAFQFIGHFIEKKKPAFMDSLKQLLIAPLFLAAELLFYFDKKKDLKKAMDDVE